MLNGYKVLGLLGLAVALSSCSMDKDGGEGGPDGSQVRTGPNTGYRSPSWATPPRQNPTINLPSNFSPATGVTHSRGRSTDPYIAMTFDDGPHPRNTPRLLDMLRQRNIKATFYVIGENVKRYPDITRRIVVEGHEIGNHTYTHGNLTKMSDSGVRSEMSRTRSEIVNATGVQPRTMRPPYGALRTKQRVMIQKEYGYPTIMWSVDPRDWQRPGVSVVRDRILTNTKPGSIVLAHDLHAPTVDAMPQTLDGLLAKGYQFVTVSQLLTLKGSEN
jgi:peptidoglycan/xylan/chitin deacetylase (PgdA/CDA1 family)